MRGTVVIAGDCTRATNLVAQVRVSDGEIPVGILCSDIRVPDTVGVTSFVAHSLRWGDAVAHDSPRVACVGKQLLARKHRYLAYLVRPGKVDVMPDATHEGQPSHMVPKFRRYQLPTQGSAAGGAIVSGPRHTLRCPGRVWDVLEQHGLALEMTVDWANNEMLTCSMPEREEQIRILRGKVRNPKYGKGHSLLGLAYNHFSWTFLAQITWSLMAGGLLCRTELEARTDCSLFRALVNRVSHTLLKGYSESG